MQIVRLRSLVCLASLVAACGGDGVSSSADAFPAAPYATLVLPAGSLVVELRTAPVQPPERGVITAELRVRDEAGAPRDGLEIGVVPFMASHGHGSSVVPQVAAMGGGIYHVTGMQLAMPGTWQLRFTLHDGELSSEASTPLEVQ